MGFPRWIRTDPADNLREVAPGIYIGAELSPRNKPRGGWGLIIDLYGSSTVPDRRPLYGNSPVLRIPFQDGSTFPPGSLNSAYTHVRETLGRNRPVLIHCQAGLSRSASCAYAMMRVLYGLSHDDALRRVKILPDFPRRKTLGSARAWVGEKKFAAELSQTLQG